MASGQLGLAIRRLERLFHGGSVAGMSEVQLLERFVARRDAAAFEALVARHGAMVLGVCRQWLRHPADVEDAFQATFLVLVRKASTLRDRELLGNWLYGVAYRVAMRARCEAARRRAREAPAVGDVADAADPPTSDLANCVHEEVRRLPEKYQAPVVLCYLEGLTHEQAAEQLHWPLGTVKGRLSRARELLRSRLARRGLAPTLAALGTVLSHDATAAVPPALVDRTTEAAGYLAAGNATAAGAISAQAVALMKGVCHTMFLGNLKIVAASLAVAALVTTGAGVVANQTPRGGGSPAPSKQIVPPGLQVAQLGGAPGGGDARPGAASTSRTGSGADAAGAEAKSSSPAEPPASPSVEVARKAIWAMEVMRKQGQAAPPGGLYEWSVRLLEAERQAGRTQADRIAAAQAHLDRMKLAADEVSKGYQSGNVSLLDSLEAQFRYQQARRWLQEAKEVPPAAPEPAAAAPPQAGAAPGIIGGIGAGGGGGFGGGGIGGGLDTTDAERDHLLRIKIAQMSGRGESRDRSPKTEAIRKTLEEPVRMSFPDETPLEDVLRFVRSATAKGSDKGIPIYVDPVGLAETEAKLESPVRIDVDGVPLKTTLRLVLKQLGLAYCIKDGLLIISSVEGICDELEEADGAPPDQGAPSDADGKRAPAR